MSYQLDITYQPDSDEELDHDALFEQNMINDEIDYNEKVSTDAMAIVNTEEKHTFSAFAKDADPANKAVEKIFLALQKNTKILECIQNTQNILYLNSDMLADAYKIIIGQKKLDLNQYASIDIQADLFRYIKLIERCVQ